MNPEQVRAIVMQELSFMLKGKKIVLPYPTQILDGNDIVIGATNGTKIGTSASQKIGFYGATPVAKQTGVLRDITNDPTTDPAGYDQYARAAAAQLNAVLTSLGIATI